MTVAPLSARNLPRAHRLPILALGLLAACSGGGGSTGSASVTNAGTTAVTLTQSNPLATSDQNTLDQLALQVNQDYPFLALKAEAETAYLAAHGLPVSSEASARLGQDIDELAFSAIQKAVNNDPWHPKVYLVDAGPHNWFGLQIPGGRYSYDNPDNIYRTIPISGSLHYVIHGQRHTPGPADVTFSLINNPNSQGTVAVLSGNDLVLNADGSYTVTVDSDPANGRVNHIQSTSQAVQLFIRNNLGDWNSDTPDTLSVQLLDDASGQSAPTEADIAAQAALNLQESIVDYGVGALGVETMANQVNTQSAPSQSSTLGTLTTQASSFGHWSITDDQALVVTVNPGGAGYFVVPLTDPWMVTVDPGGHQLSLNEAQAQANADGTYTFVIATQDPGVYNWLDTAGLHEGTMMARWQDLPGTTPASGGPAITTQLVALSQLSTVLPANTRMVTPAERQQQLAARAAGYALRFATP
jgi:hypothetical protein